MPGIVFGPHPRSIAALTDIGGVFPMYAQPAFCLYSTGKRRKKKNMVDVRIVGRVKGLGRKMAQGTVKRHRLSSGPCCLRRGEPHPFFFFFLVSASNLKSATR